MTWRLAQFSICCTGTAGTGRARLQWLRKNPDSSGFWEGHDFSRAAKSLKMACASAPEVCSLRPLGVFPQTLHPCRQGLQRVSASAAVGNALQTITRSALALLLGTLALSTHWLSTQDLAHSVRGSQSPTSQRAVLLTVKDAEALALKNNPAISV